MPMPKFFLIIIICLSYQTALSPLNHCGSNIQKFLIPSGYITNLWSISKIIRRRLLNGMFQFFCVGYILPIIYQQPSPVIAATQGQAIHRRLATDCLSSRELLLAMTKLLLYHYLPITLRLIRPVVSNPQILRRACEFGELHADFSKCRRNFFINSLKDKHQLYIFLPQTICAKT